MINHNYNLWVLVQDLIDYLKYYNIILYQTIIINIKLKYVTKMINAYKKYIIQQIYCKIKINILLIFFMIKQTIKIYNNNNYYKYNKKKWMIMQYMFIKIYVHNT